MLIFCRCAALMMQISQSLPITAPVQFPVRLALRTRAAGFKDVGQAPIV